MDYGRYKFEALKREKDSRREHNIVRVKEMKLRPKISEHDFRTKYGYVRHFLEEGDKVKLTIMFRGREMVHQEYGRKLLDRMAEELKDVAAIERNPLVEGRNMIMIMNPLGKKASNVKPAGRGDKPATTEATAAYAKAVADAEAGITAPAVAAATAVADKPAIAESQTPKAEAPKAEAPKAEAPKAEAPQAAAAEAPAPEAAKAPAPKAAAKPRATAAKAAAPKTESSPAAAGTAASGRTTAAKEGSDAKDQDA
jgi:translation initiation factor IF-3